MFLQISPIAVAVAIALALAVPAPDTCGFGSTQGAHYESGPGTVHRATFTGHSIHFQNNSTVINLTFIQQINYFLLFQQYDAILSENIYCAIQGGLTIFIFSDPRRLLSYPAHLVVLCVLRGRSQKCARPQVGMSVRPAGPFLYSRKLFVECKSVYNFK